MATVVTYNSVELHNVQTKQWDEEIVYDPSNTDVMFHRFKLRFAGIIHNQGSVSGSGSLGDEGSSPSAPAWIAVPGQRDSITGMWTSVAALLSTPRCELTVTVNGQRLLHVIGYNLSN